MADGVAITAGSGTTIATDDSGASGHVQIVKLALSADGSATPIPADATWGLEVDVSRIQPVSVNKTVTQTTAQTGSAVWTPAAGKAVVITSLQIQSFGVTAGTAIVWFGGSADTTYTRGTDLPIFDGEFAPTATNKPGVYVTFPTPIRGTADFVLRLTTTNAQSITVSVWGYEI